MSLPNPVQQAGFFSGPEGKVVPHLAVGLRSGLVVYDTAGRETRQQQGGWIFLSASGLYFCAYQPTERDRAAAGVIYRITGEEIGRFSIPTSGHRGLPKPDQNRFFVASDGTVVAELPQDSGPLGHRSAIHSFRPGVEAPVVLPTPLALTLIAPAQNAPVVAVAGVGTEAREDGAGNLCTTVFLYRTNGPLLWQREFPHTRPMALAAAADGSHVAVSLQHHAEGNFRQIEACRTYMLEARGQPVATAEEGLHELVFLPAAGELYLLGVTGSGELHCVASATGKVQWRKKLKGDERLLAWTALDAAGGRVVVATGHGSISEAKEWTQKRSVSLLDAQGQVLWEHSLEEATRAGTEATLVRLSPDGKFLAVADQGVLSVYSLESLDGGK